MSNPFSRDASDEIKKTLFKNANEGKWDEVVEIYKKHPESHTAKITSSCDTALHIAISNGDEPIVKSLVDLVCNTKGALELQNELGNTPLHLAAYLGNAEMCHCIAACNSKLMGIRNGDNETPFFLAVRHGRKEAFHALHAAICKTNEGDEYCRGKDGETILHSAISGEYFDLAFDIIHHYPKLLNAITQHGFSPLHVLANKPSAFRSGSLIRGLDKLIYLCIFVDELKLNKIHAKATDLQYKDDAPYPGNYHTCVATFNLLTNVTQILLGRGGRENRDGQKQHVVSRVLCGSRKADAERRQFVEADKLEKGPDSRNINAQGHELFPKNCTTFFNIAKLISKAMLVILGLGSKSVEKMRGKKEKHIWSVQVMEKLLEHASLYQYEDNGKSPIPAGKSTPALSYTLSNIGADAGADELMSPTTVDEIVDATEGHAAEKEKKSTPNKAQGEKEKCWRETLCAVLQSLGVVQNNPSLKTVCPEGKGGAALDMERKETPILIAAKNGVEEMVWGILKQFPVAIHDMDHDKKNIVLLAVEHRQPHVYNLLHQRKIMNETIFRKTDKDGNSALHLAARLGEYRPWLIPGAALQMQWEIKWYEFVKNSMPLHFFPRYNNESNTPRDIFSKTHNELVKEGGAWLTNTSQSCSVVAALIATVAFATSATVPGGVKSDDSGTPTLQNEPAFNIFAISSLVALCFSVTSVVMFLAILTSRFQEKDFGKDLPRKLLIGLTSLFISIGSMLLSFCAGHFFVLKQKLQYAAFPMYAITCLPVTFFAVAQFPLYFDLIWATIRKIPQRSSK